MLCLGFSSPMLFHAFKYRDRTTIVNDILESVKTKNEGKRKTQIMQSAGLNYTQTKKYLNYLLNYGYLAVTEKETYIITSEGSRYLHLIELQRLNIIR